MIERINKIDGTKIARRSDRTMCIEGRLDRYRLDDGDGDGLWVKIDKWHCERKHQRIKLNEDRGKGKNEYVRARVCVCVGCVHSTYQCIWQGKRAARKKRVNETSFNRASNIHTYASLWQ